jgi:polysaccharide transporter, PST family
MAAQLVGMAAPLLTIPWLARVLGPAGWAPVLLAQGLAAWLLLVLEFGFDLSGTRAVARARATGTELAEVVSGVQGARLLLVAATIPLVAAVLLLVPALRSDPRLVAWALAFAVLRGFNPLWFFQGMERVHGAVLVDITTRTAAAAGVFVLVQSPGDGWKVLALQAVMAGLALLILTRTMHRHLAFHRPQLSSALATLRQGSTMFACRASSGLYMQANTLILGAMAPPLTVALFGGAERIVRAAVNLLQPLTQAFLPRLSWMQAVDARGADTTVRWSLLGVGLLGALLGASAWLGAPILVQVILGRGYEGAVPVLRTLAILPPLVAVNTVLAIYWAIPLGRERAFLGAILAAGAVNVALAVMLVPRHGAGGMATAAAAAEVVIFAVLGTLYLRRRA